jgi:hypothetical protein
MKKEILIAAFFMALSAASFSQSTVSAGRTAVTEPAKEIKGLPEETNGKAVTSAKDAKTEEPANTPATVPSANTITSPASAEKQQPAPEK